LKAHGELPFSNGNATRLVTKGDASERPLFMGSSSGMNDLVVQREPVAFFAT
jgi:hypothetical protein